MIAIGGKDSWQWRCLEATCEIWSGRRSPRGMILRAAFQNNGVGPHSFPRLAYSAEISKEGIVQVQCAKTEGSEVRKINLCTAQVLVDSFRRLADELKLNDQDRIALFTCIRQWIGKDHRAISNMAGDYQHEA
jgi:hypothetical protein